MLKQCIAIGEIRASQIAYITVRPASRFTSQKPKLSHAMASTLEENLADAKVTLRQARGKEGSLVWAGCLIIDRSR